MVLVLLLVICGLFLQIMMIVMLRRVVMVVQVVYMLRLFCIMMWIYQMFIFLLFFLRNLMFLLRWWYEMNMQMYRVKVMKNRMMKVMIMCFLLKRRIQDRFRYMLIMKQMKNVQGRRVGLQYRGLEDVFWNKLMMVQMIQIVFYMQIIFQILNIYLVGVIFIWYLLEIVFVLFLKIFVEKKCFFFKCLMLNIVNLLYYVSI